MPNYVRGEGNSHSKLVVLGEAPGKHEDESGHPFWGPSGDMVDEFLISVGTSRHEVWLTNVHKYRPNNNIFSTIPKDELAKSIESLKKEVTQIGPNLVLALGLNAFHAIAPVTGKMQDLRGSLYWSRTLGCKVMATFHPASLIHQGRSEGGIEGERSFKYYNRHLIQLDFARAVAQSRFRKLNTPKRHVEICKNSSDLYRYIHRNRDKKRLTIDIEVIHAFPVCVGIGFTPYDIMVVPLFQQVARIPLTSMSVAELSLCWQMLAQLFNNPEIRKEGQNFKFDQDKLEKLGFTFRNFGVDTNLLAHTLQPELPKRLEFLQSILTLEPYHKSEGKEFKAGKDRIEIFYNYCAKDVGVQSEIALLMLEDLKEEKMEDFFFKFVMLLHEIYLRMENRGFRIDKEARKQIIKNRRKEQRELQRELNELVEENLNVKSPRVNIVLYDILKIPRRKSADEATLVGLLSTKGLRDEKKRKVIRLILRIRKIRDFISRYASAGLDFDGRMRTVCKISGTESGRTSTGILRPPVRPKQLGIALQTLTKHGTVGQEIREMFIPDDGYVFLEIDQAQAEARVVALLAGDDELLQMFNSGQDVHKITASWINDRPIEKITKEERQLGKTVRHAGNYDMGERRLVDLVQVDAENYHMDLTISRWRAAEVLKSFHRHSPKIRGVYHTEVKRLIGDYQQLVSPQGRKRTFYDRWGERLWKEGYSYLPQATVSDKTKEVMIWINDNLPDVLLMLEMHDGILTQVPIAKVEEYARLIIEQFERPIDFSRCSIPRGSLVIPAEASVGKKNWRFMETL